MTEKAEEEKVEVKRGLTLKTIVIGIICVIAIASLGIMHETTTSGGFGYGMQLGHLTFDMSWFAGAGMCYYFYYGLGLFVMLAIVIAVVNSVKPVFSRQEVAVLAVMILASSIVCGWYAYDSPFNNILGIAPGASAYGQAWVDGNKIFSYLPDLLGPKDVDWWRARILPRPDGSGVVDWGTHMPTIVWFSLFLIGLVGTIGFTALLLRRVYVDVEALQFPTMDITGGVVEMTQPGSRGAKFFTNPYFLIGFLVQAIWYAVFIIQGVLGWGGPGLGAVPQIDTFVGQIPGTTIYAWPIWQHEWISTAALPWVPLMISLPLWQVGWGALLSTEVLIGVVGGWLVFWFLWPLASTAAGLLPAYTPRGMQYTAWYTLWRPSAIYNANLVTVALGFIVGLAVLPLWRNRSTLGPILKLWKEPPAEVDPARPIPYRMVWVGLIVSVLLTVAMGAVVEVMPLPFLVFLIVLVFLNMGYIRMYAETGGWYGVFESIVYHPMPLGIAMSLVLATLFKDVMWSHGADATLAQSMTVAFTLPVLTAGGIYYLHSRAGAAILNPFKLGSTTRTDLKDMAKAVAIALGLGIFVASIMFYVWIYSVGIKDPGTYGWNSYVRSGAGWYAGFSYAYAKGDVAGIWFGSITNIFGAPAQDYVVKFIVGLAICLIVAFMRGRFTWFRISAAGLALGAMFGREIWSPFLLALVIKYLMIRMGGTKLYTEKLRPLSIGFIAGWAIMFAVGVFISDYSAWLWHLSH